MQPFLGSDRYRIERKLGEGGMGVVYLAFDRIQKAQVALKTLRNAHPVEIAALKAEFRSLAGIAHPNLVSFYELAHEANHWFVTMELLNGQSLHERLEAFRANSFKAPPDGPTTPVLGDVSAFVPSAPIMTPGLSMEEVRGIFAQIALGLNALHDAGKLHRDLKPSNVMVTASGRVVILDFGLVQSLGAGASGRGGTPAFMSPEQVRGDRLTTASDWYAFGVTLYRALSSTLPFAGDSNSVLKAKLQTKAPSLRELLPALPASLTSLCDELLHIDPTLRPSGRDVSRRLNELDSIEISSSISGGSIPPVTGRVFVGRDRELEQLSVAFQRTERGELSLVLLWGESGVGKSALIRHFLDRKKERGATVLTGRCFERENLPYKLLDHFVEGLGDLLLDVDPQAIRIPDGMQALLTLFPSLRRVAAFQSLSLETPTDVDTRAVGFAALRELLVQVPGPVAVWIDDVQWGDEESLGFFASIDRAETPTPVFFVLSSRTGDTPVHRWTEKLAGGPVRDALTQLQLRALEMADARALALSLIGREDTDARFHADRVARESGGSPLLLGLLGSRLILGQIPSVRDLIILKVQALDPAVSEVLFAISVAVRPIPQRIVTEFGSSPEQVLGALAILRAERLIRAADDDRDRVEPYHDRVREVVLELLEGDQAKRLHETLAIAFVRLDPDPEILALHFSAAGHGERAAKYALEAGDRARAALAASRAADLYAIALRHPPSGTSTLDILVRRAEALAGSGRGREAGEVFLEVASQVEASRSSHFRRRALGAYLTSGYLAESRDAIRPELEWLGVRLPRSAWTSLASALVDESWTKVVKANVDRPVSDEDRARLDLLWDIARGYAIFDFTYASGLLARHHLLARQVGDPAHMLRGMAAALGPLGAMGKVEKFERQRQLLEGMAEQIGTPDARGHALYGAAVAEAFLGRWIATYDDAKEAQKHLRGSEESSREFFSSKIFMALACAETGRIVELRRIVDQVIVDSAVRGDQWAAIMVRTGVCIIAWLAAGDVDGAEARFRESLTMSEGRGYSSFDGYNLMAQAMLSMVRGRPQEALDLTLRGRAGLERSLFLHAQINRIHFFDIQGRAGLMAATDASRSLVKKCVRKLKAEGTPQALGCAHVLLAGLVPSGKSDQTIEHLRDAERHFESAGMMLHVRSIRRRRGKMLAGDTGRQLVAESDRWFRDQEVRDPSLLESLLVPG